MVHVMTSMELDDEGKLDAPAPMPMSEKPDYPYGLRICLCSAELDKLDLDVSEAVIGGIVHLHALATVTSVSMDAGEYGSNCRVELQITAMAVESEDEENEEVG